MGIHDVGCPAGCKHPPNARRINSVERDDSRCRLPDQSSESHLAFGPADRLGQGRSRHRDRRARLSGSSQQHDDSTIVAVEGDQCACIERKSRHHATERVRRFGFPSISSAHAFSSRESGPPVSRSACASRAPQPAMSSSDTPTACCTNPETLDAFPASTSSRTRASCAASSVIVTFLVAIPFTILGNGSAATNIRAKNQRFRYCMVWLSPSPPCCGHPERSTNPCELKKNPPEVTSAVFASGTCRSAASPRSCCTASRT